MSAVSLMGAWLCASGAMLDIAQVFAWTRMFAGYAATESLSAAIGETFDPGKPCEICRAVGRAREASDRRAPAVPSSGAAKVVLILERSAALVGQSAGRTWPVADSAAAQARSADVPVPPPRNAVA
ncbi:MAG TPA: hypothetical protein VN775_04035 [Opitutaceae bacterium]|nr:hypothetical protein [Opitutaceae bacterium]